LDLIFNQKPNLKISDKHTVEFNLEGKPAGDYLISGVNDRKNGLVKIPRIR